MAEGTLLAGRYRLEGRLGRGGMGDVWRARDEFLGRTVAVKEVRLPAGPSEERRADLHERLLQEARAAAALPHPSIITVHDVLRQDDRPWIVMDLIDGPSLESVRVEQGPLPPRRVAEIGLQLLDALCLAHDRGILHRDVKPANVLLSGDRAILTDFGIAVLAGDHRAVSAEGIVGSPGYMAPERLRDGPGAGPSSDLWSLGATLYAAVEGRRPFEKPDALAMLGAVLTEDVPPPRLAGPELGPLLVAMMDRNPNLRPVPAEIRKVLQRVAGIAPSASPPAPTLPGLRPAVPGNVPAARRGRRHLLLGTAALAVPLLAVAGYLLRPADTGPPPAPPPAAAPSPSLTAAPDPCSLLTREQERALNASSSGRRKDTVTCYWSLGEGELEVKVRFLDDRGGRSGEDLAKDTFALLKRQAEGSTGADSDPAFTVSDSPVRDIPGLGDEAFLQELSMSGAYATADTAVCVRSGRLLVEVQYNRFGTSRLTDAERSVPQQVARQALENLGR